MASTESSKRFSKSCIECGEDIPLSRVTCPFCGAEQGRKLTAPPLPPPPYTPPRIEKSEREIPIDELCEHLKRMGLDATAEFETDNLRGSLLKLNLGLEPRERVIGLIRVANRNIDVVELELCITEMGGDYGFFENGYRCNYVVLTNVEGSEDKLKAKLEPIRKGFLSSEVVDFKWKGKELAQMLSSDANLKDMLYRMKRILTYLEIIPYRELQCVKIRQWPGRKVSAVSPTIEAFEAFDRIAQHIRSIADAHL